VVGLLPSIGSILASGGADALVQKADDVFLLSGAFGGGEEGGGAGCGCLGGGCACWAGAGWEVSMYAGMQDKVR